MPENARTAAPVSESALWKQYLKHNRKSFTAKGRGKALPFFYLLIFTASFLNAQAGEQSLPRIQRLNTRDTVFAQFLSDVEISRRQIFLTSGNRNSLSAIAESLTVYLYTPEQGETILTLSARCNLPYSTLATINRLSNTADFSHGRTMLLPSVPGLFIPETPQTELEFLLHSSRQEQGIRLAIDDGNNKVGWYFLPGADFNTTERTFFLNRGFYFPLRSFNITSSFGPRQNPVTGTHGIHQGVDLAAPMGTPVYPAREGIVSEQGEDAVMGKYIIITHGENWVSLYGHLSVIETVLRQQVNSGTLIGRVGSTGQSTVPHLHFELRQNGRPQDPEKLLRLFQ